jgi:hypothetical protein
MGKCNNRHVTGLVLQRHFVVMCALRSGTIRSDYLEERPGRVVSKT